MTVLILFAFIVVSLFSSLVGQFEMVYHYEGDEAASQYTAAEKLEYYHVYANAYSSYGERTS